MTERSAEIRAERRARRQAGDGIQRLDHDESKLDRAHFRYRWVDDTGTRMEVLKEYEDYDIAPEGQVKIAGTNRDGSQQRMVLMRKPIELHDEDTAAKQAKIDAEEARIREGDVGEGTYVPKGTPIEIGGKKTGARR